MLGTDLKNLLTRCGITQEWYKQSKAELGLDPTCNCEMYESLLNAAHKGYKRGGWKEAKKSYETMKKYYAKPR